MWAVVRDLTARIARCRRRVNDGLARHEEDAGHGATLFVGRAGRSIWVRELWLENRIGQVIYVDERKVTGAMFGLAVGDALGVPVEFSSRDARRAQTAKAEPASNDHLDTIKPRQLHSSPVKDPHSLSLAATAAQCSA